MTTSQENVRCIEPGEFEPEEHFYPRVPNAALHPLVRAFLNLGNERIALRYSHLHPEANIAVVREVLSTRPAHFRWSGADLFHVTTDRGIRQNVIIETNSCPSGQKSMPLLNDDEHGGYGALIEKAFLPSLKMQRGLPSGGLAVLCDKNPMETLGYARTLADLTGEKVLWVDFSHDSWQERARWESGVLHVLHDGAWQPIRAAFRYVTIRPWNRIPTQTRTWMFNPVSVCLAGGRNKLLAAKAYDFFNADMAESGLQIRTPDTIWDVHLPEVPLWIERMGGVAVVKNPYSNAGVGVYTITSAAELKAFMALDHRYQRFIVQGLIGNLGWTSQTRHGKLYHVGMVPNRKGEIYVADLRLMIAGTPSGFTPIALYGRRAPTPLAEALTESSDSWSMLGTNLSRKTETGWTTEPHRLVMMDQRDFNTLGVGLDDLTEAYLQTGMATLAIDRMVSQLRTKKGQFRRKLFASLVPDPNLVAEIMA
ncbi:MAG: hypothetical protein AB8H79_15120 [Myxococcota bacterium]